MLSFYSTEQSVTLQFVESNIYVVLIKNRDWIRISVNEKPNSLAMLGRIEYMETVRISVKILLCYNEIGVASQISSIGGGPNGQ